MAMSANNGARQTLDHAGECIRQALKTWHGADVERIASAQELLERALADLREATQALREGRAEDPVELRAAMTVLKRDLARMFRVVDACAAFRRGLELRLGNSGVAYGANGEISAGVIPITRGGLQG